MKTRNFILTMAVTCSLLWLSACDDQSGEILPKTPEPQKAAATVEGGTQEIDRD